MNYFVGHPIYSKTRREIFSIFLLGGGGIISSTFPQWMFFMQDTYQVQ